MYCQLCLNLFVFYAYPSTYKSPHALTFQQHSCPSSSLGYSCSYVINAATVHWTIGTSAAPSNACTRQGLPTNSSSAANAADMLHMAIQVPTTGYVGLGFSQSNKMFNTDAVLGYVSGMQAMVDNWNIPDGNYYYINTGNMARPAWTTAMAVVQGPPAGGGATETTVCFSRPLQASSASVSTVISKSSAVTMSFAAADNGVTDFSSPHLYRGSFSINLATGAVAIIDPFDRKSVMIVHGALMATAWMLLLPLGTLLARHKWMLGETKLFGQHLWFQLHLALQLSGIAVFVVGFVWPHAYLPAGPTTGGQCGQAHSLLGHIVIGLATAQVAVGFIRPAPDAKLRWLWNIVHHWLGRITLVAAWTTTFIGIYIAHESLAYQVRAGCREGDQDDS